MKRHIILAIALIYILTSCSSLKPMEAPRKVPVTKVVQTPIQTPAEQAEPVLEPVEDAPCIEVTEEDPAPVLEEAEEETISPVEEAPVPHDPVVIVTAFDIPEDEPQRQQGRGIMPIAIAMIVLTCILFIGWRRMLSE